MSGKWIPADDELDAMARSMPVADRGADRVEHERTSLLAQAAGTTQQRRRSRMPIVAGAVAAFAAAAGLILWLVVRPPAPAHASESITALGPAHYERAATWPDFKVRLDDGRIEVRVSKLASGDRFRVVTTDAEVEVHGTQFVVGADHGSIASVAVIEGRLEVRWLHEPPVVVSAGQTWSPTRTAQRDDVPPAPPAQQAGATTKETAAGATTKQTAAGATTRETAASPTTKQTATGPMTRETAASLTTRETAAGPTTRETAASPTTKQDPRIATNPSGRESTKAAVSGAQPADTEATAKPHPLAPGEAQFRAGIASLRAGDATAAVTSFASACKTAEKQALGEDACFWLGAAAKRAGKTSTAREALTRFLEVFPTSARAGEASALLGWLLYDAGELEAAQQQFELATRDRVPKVKQSAERGLEAIKRKRAAP